MLGARNSTPGRQPRDGGHRTRDHRGRADRPAVALTSRTAWGDCAPWGEWRRAGGGVPGRCEGSLSDVRHPQAGGHDVPEPRVPEPPSAARPADPGPSRTWAGADPPLRGVNAVRPAGLPSEGRGHHFRANRHPHRGPGGVTVSAGSGAVIPSYPLVEPSHRTAFHGPGHRGLVVLARRPFVADGAGRSGSARSPKPRTHAPWRTVVLLKGRSESVLAAQESRLVSCTSGSRFAGHQHRWMSSAARGHRALGRNKGRDHGSGNRQVVQR